MIVSIGNKSCLENGFRKNIVRKCPFGIFLEKSLIGLFGLNAMTRCLIKNNGTLRKSNIRFGMNSLFTPKLLGSGSWSKSRIVEPRRLPWFKGLISLGMIGKSYVEGKICTLRGIGKDNVVRWFLGG